MTDTTRAGETVSRQAHNLETLGSTPRPAIEAEGRRQPRDLRSGIIRLCQPIREHRSPAEPSSVKERERYGRPSLSPLMALGADLIDRTEERMATRKKSLGEGDE